MTQRHINSAVARATGESLCTIRQRGFSPLSFSPPDDEPEPMVLDWDRPGGPGAAYLSEFSGMLPTAA